MRHGVRLGLVALLCVAPAAHAQSGTLVIDTARTDPVFIRARELVVNGNGAAGRMLVDSVVTARVPGTPAYADALFWRAALAADGVDAERDYRRIVVEYPLSRHAGDALFQLAQLETARGDRASAITHLERFMLENPTHPDRARAGLSLIRLLFDDGDPRHACRVLGRTEPGVSAANVELRNQFAYFDPRCAGVDTTVVRPAATAPEKKSRASTDTPPKPRERKESATTPDRPREAATKSRNAEKPAAKPRQDAAPKAKARASAGRYTLQVAAYTDRADAERLAKKLVARGMDARVVGTSKLFRVRIGHFATRAAAAAEAKTLKAKKIDTFVTETDGEEK